MNEFFNELKRRNVIRVAIAYAAVGWVILQFVDVVAPLMGLPESFQKGVLLILGIGLPVVLFFSWAYEVTPEGVMKTEEVDKSKSITHGTGQKINRLTIGALVLVVGFFVYDKFIAETPVSFSLGEREASIAVLPFADLSPDGSQEYFGDGIAEEILNVLAKIPEMKVAGRTSSFKFKGQNENLQLIADQLNVDHVLEGSVRKDGDTIRVTVQLIAADDGFHLWSETYDRDLVDIFKIQDEISQAVADAMQIQLGTGQGEEATHSIASAEAYSLYLRARELLRTRGTENLANAVKLFEAVTVLDPEFDGAYSGLSKTFALLPAYEVVLGSVADQYYLKGVAAGQRAIELNPQNAEAYSALSYLNMFRRDWAAADKNTLMATTLAPNDPEIANLAGDYYRFIGDFENAVKWETRAFELDPLQVVHSWDLGFAYFDFGYYEEALPHAENALKVDPNYVFVYRLYAYALSALGRFDEARDIIAQAENSATRQFGLHDMKVDLAINEGDFGASREFLREMANIIESGQGGAPSFLAFRYLTLGEIEEGLKWFNRAYAEGDPFLVAVPAFLPENHTSDPEIIAQFELPGMKELFDIRRKHQAEGNGQKQ